MDDLMIITYTNGQMTVNMDQFFPCTKGKFKQLLKVIKLDLVHYEALIEILKVHFQKRIANLPAEAEEYKQKAAEYRKKAELCKKQCKEEKKKAKAAGIMYDPFNDFETEYENNSFFAKQAEQDFKNILKSKEKYEEFLRLL